MKIKKYIQSDDLEDIRSVMKLNELKKNKSCPNLQKNFHDSFQNFMH